jgi:GrpB-like predicted nucleotidyltransferase (UPF0157 family)
LLLDDEVHVVEHDPRWATTFQQISEPLRRALGENCARIDHMGSTSVPSLWAKPIIDVNVGLAPGGSFPAEVAQRCGATFRAVNPESVLFAIYDGDRRIANIHVRYTGSEPERWDLLFRDFMRAHPEIAERYSAAKRQAALEHPTDRTAYSRAKGAFITNLAPDIEAWATATNWNT